MPSKKVGTVLLDPPWPEFGGGKIKRGADRHYILIKKKEDILKAVLQSGVWPGWEKDESAHMYMWVTNNYLEWGLWLMAALGFKYKTNIVWVKIKADWPKEIYDILSSRLSEKITASATETVIDLKVEDWLHLLEHATRIGMGQYFRGSHELVLFGVRGKTCKPQKALPTVFHAPREKEDDAEKHSKKPRRSYEIIEASSPGPYLEFFARSKRKNWRSWGNEV